MIIEAAEINAVHPQLPPHCCLCCGLEGIRGCTLQIRCRRLSTRDNLVSES